MAAPKPPSRATKFDWTTARRMHSHGVGYTEIGRKLGVGYHAVRLACDPEYRERQRARWQPRERVVSGVPVGRLRPLVMAALRDIDFDAPLSRSVVAPLAERCHIPRAELDRIARGRSVSVAEDTADRLLCGLDLTYLWHVPAEQGGLADLYETEEVAA